MGNNNKREIKEGSENIKGITTYDYQLHDYFFLFFLPLSLPRIIYNFSDFFLNIY